jgi:hypothetical protein
MSVSSLPSWDAQTERELRRQLAVLETRHFLAQAMRERLALLTVYMGGAMISIGIALRMLYPSLVGLPAAPSSAGAVLIAQILIFALLFGVAILFLVGRLRSLRSQGELLRLKLEMFDASPSVAGIDKLFART